MKVYMKFSVTFVLLSLLFIVYKSEAFAYNVMPASDNYYYKTLCGTYVYEEAVIGAKPVTYLDINFSLYVTGITDTGFYQILLNKRPAYVSGLCVDMISKYPTGIEAIKGAFNKIADAYNMQLETSYKYIDSFGLLDITGDGFPELIAANGKEIYSYYNEKPVMIYYSDTPKTFYYNKNLGFVISSRSNYGNTVYEILTMNYSLLPWGQLTCYMPGLCGQDIKTYKTIDFCYNNEEEVRQKLGETLYSLYVAGSI